MSETTQSAPELKRSMKIVPGYDCILIQPCVHGSTKCKPGSGSNHGRHSAELVMSVSYGEAEVAFLAYTGLYPSGFLSSTPATGGEVVWHTSWPQDFQNEEDRGEPNENALCKNWSACYRTTAGLYAYKLFDLLISKGSDAVYEKLEEEYYELTKNRKGS